MNSKQIIEQRDTLYTCDALMRKDRPAQYISKPQSSVYSLHTLWLSARIFFSGGGDNIPLFLTIGNGFYCSFYCVCILF